MKLILLALLIPATSLPVYAQGPTEAEQKFACMGDALRLCTRSIPNRERIIECLASQHDALSAGCRPVFDASYKALVARRHR